MKPEIVVIGAGAIGRGFLPWKFQNDYDFVFVDINASVVNRMKTAREFSTYRIKSHEIQELRVHVKGAYLPNEFNSANHKNIAAIFVNVGPRNVVEAVRIMAGAKCPVILCENDPNKVETLKRHSQLENVCFAIPDVITSNTAPQKFLDKDPLSVMTEDGILFIESSGVGTLKGDFVSCDTEELKKQWNAKLYLHNTPHCIAAYLGAWVGATYVHEVMQNSKIREVVRAAMYEMLTMMKSEWNYSTEFLEWYAAKELQRFSDEYLFDPVSRVAREPLRKLERDGRLIGAAQLCLAHGALPKNVLVGIVSAMLFDNKNDPDSHISFMKGSLSPSSFLTHVLKLRKGEALDLALTRELDGIIRTLTDISRDQNYRTPRDSQREATVWK